MGSSFLHLQAVVTYLLGQKMRPLIMNAEAISPKASSAILSSATTGMLHARFLSFPTNVDSRLQTPISLAIPTRKTRFESVLRRKNARRCYMGHDQWQSRAMHMGMSLRNLALDDRGVYLRWGVSRNQRYLGMQAMRMWCASRRPRWECTFSNAVDFPLPLVTLFSTAVL